MMRPYYSIQMRRAIVSSFQFRCLLPVFCNSYIKGKFDVRYFQRYVSMRSEIILAFSEHFFAASVLLLRKIISAVPPQGTCLKKTQPRGRHRRKQAEVVSFTWFAETALYCYSPLTNHIMHRLYPFLQVGGNGGRGLTM